MVGLTQYPWFCCQFCWSVQDFFPVSTFLPERSFMFKSYWWVVWWPMHVVLVSALSPFIRPFIGSKWTLGLELGLGFGLDKIWNVASMKIKLLDNHIIVTMTMTASNVVSHLCWGTLVWSLINYIFEKIWYKSFFLGTESQSWASYCHYVGRCLG